MAIRKKASSIKERTYMAYSPEAVKALSRPNFIECDAEYALKHINPAPIEGLSGKWICFDTETEPTGIAANLMPPNVVRRWVSRGSKDIPNDFPFSIQLCDGTNSFCIYDSWSKGFEEFKKLREILSEPSIGKTAHNGKYDLHQCKNAGIDVRGQLFDSLPASKICRAWALTHSLADNAKEIENGILDFEYMVDEYKSRFRVSNYAQIDRDLLTQYGCADVWNGFYVTKRLLAIAREHEDDGWLPLILLENEIIKITYLAEREGVLIDDSYKDALFESLTLQKDEAERKVYEAAGEFFNMNSGQQLESVLKKLGYGSLIKYGEPTQAMLNKGITRGNPRFRKDDKERMISQGCTILEDIQSYQKAEKLLNSFAKKLYTMKDAENRVHCNFNTAEAKTGRFSISLPSFQNMPRRGESRIRKAFIAPEGYTIYELDYASQESKIMVHYSRDEFLINSLHEGKDIHKIFASMIFAAPYEEVTKDQRQVAKSVEFAIVYGAGAAKVATMSGISEYEAKQVMADVRKRMPSVDVFIKTVNKIAKERGWVKTVRGRRVYLERGREYACVNYCVQGSAADCTKGAMKRVNAYLRGNKYKTKLVLQVHDSMMFYVANDEADIVIPKLKYLMAETNLFRVPITADVGKSTDGTWAGKDDVPVDALAPTPEEQAKMDAYDIWGDCYE